MVQKEPCAEMVSAVLQKYVYDYGLTDKTTITIETKGGIKELDLTVEDGKVTWVKVDMEAPITKSFTDSCNL